jgi:hypothetical protein
MGKQGGGGGRCHGQCRGCTRNRSIRSSSSLKGKNIIKSQRVGDEHEKIENQTCAHAAAPFGSNCDTEELAEGLWMRVGSARVAAAERRRRTAKSCKPPISKCVPNGSS